MYTFRNILKLSAGAALAVLFMVACSKPEEPPALPPVSSRTVEPPKPKESSAIPVSSMKSAKSGPVAPTPGTLPLPDPAASGESVSQVENAYVANPDFTERVQNIYKLTDLGTPEAMAALGRLFHMEKDTDLKVEIMTSLFDVDGQDDRKAALLAAGTLPSEPKEVRQSAIDGLGDIDGKYAIPILQSLANDPDDEIKELVKDTIEQLQTQTALQK